jgi:putative DNA primase/helicase
MIIAEIVSEAAARLNLIQGRDGKWRGPCPACSYSKPTLEIALHDGRIAIACTACGAVPHIAAIMGIAQELVVAPTVEVSKVTRALRAWRNASSAIGTSVETYLHNRGIKIPVPASIRFLPRQRNWSDGGTYPTMISLVQRVEDHGVLPIRHPLVDSGAHFTFLEGGGLAGPIRKASIDCPKLTLGRLRYGGVWLTPFAEIGEQLAVSEGIETALSVMQITKLPAVAALSAAVLRSFRWPPQVKRLWIAADNDDAGLKAAKVLLGRALRAGLEAQIKIPTAGKNDFNDLLRAT